MTSHIKSQVLAILTVALLLTLCFMPDIAHAAGASGSATSGTEFNEIYNQIKGWTQGQLGRLLALLSLLVGMGIGVARQSIITALVGLGVALVLTYGPGVIEGIFTAAIPVSAAIPM